MLPLAASFSHDSSAIPWRWQWPPVLSCAKGCLFVSGVKGKKAKRISCERLRGQETSEFWTFERSGGCWKKPRDWHQNHGRFFENAFSELFDWRWPPHHQTNQVSGYGNFSNNPAKRQLPEVSPGVNLAGRGQPRIQSESRWGSSWILGLLHVLKIRHMLLLQVFKNENWFFSWKIASCVSSRLGN